MAKLKFNVRDDLVQPEYPCGKADKSISIHEHGSKWCEWKLQDMAEKHMKACKGCKNNLLGKSEDEVLAFFIKLAAETREAALALKRMDMVMDAAAELLVNALGAVVLEDEAAVA